MSSDEALGTIHNANHSKPVLSGHSLSDFITSLSPKLFFKYLL